jgi:glycosyltransferase involved in cell wall biosynthesis
MEKFHMNIVFVVDELATIGGVQSSIRNISHYLAEAGHSVYHVTIHDSPLSDPHSNRLDLGLPKTNDRERRLLTGRNLERVSGYLTSLGPAVLLMQSPNAVAWMRSVRLPGLVRVGQYHGQATYAANSYHKRFIAEEYSQLDYSVFLTDEDESWFLRECGVSRSVVLSNVLRPAPICPRAKREKRVLSAGRFSPEKRFDRVIRAFEGIGHPEWELRLVGDGVLDRDIREWAHLSRERGHRVEVASARNLEKMEEEYARASIFVLGSETEGFGMVVSEAAIRRLPVVAFDVSPGLREQIQNGVNGYLVPDGRVNEFSRRIQCLIDHPQHRAALGAQGALSASRYVGRAAAEKWLQFVARISREHVHVLGSAAPRKGCR